jgi:hypothetical protein
MSGLTAGEKENATPLNASRSSQDPRMYIVLEEEDRYEREARERDKDKEKDKRAGRISVGTKEKRKQELSMMNVKIPQIAPFVEPKDSQRAKDLDKYRLLEEDLKLIVEGNHPFSIYVPDFKKMTKKQLDEYGRTIFPEDGDKRKMFASEARVAGVLAMHQNAKDLAATDDYTI